MFGAMVTGLLGDWEKGGGDGYLWGLGKMRRDSRPRFQRGRCGYVAWERNSPVWVRGTSGWRGDVISRHYIMHHARNSPKRGNVGRGVGPY